MEFEYFSLDFLYFVGISTVKLLITLSCSPQWYDMRINTRHLRLRVKEEGNEEIEST